MRKLIFDYWDLKYGFFDYWEEDLKFCLDVLKGLNKKHISWDWFLRPLRKAYFQQRIEWLLDMYKKSEIN